MIEVQHLTRRYGKTDAVCDVTFKIRNGHVYGLVGPRGAGKSTVLDLMAGCMAPTEGTVLINGYDIRKNPQEAKRQIGYMPADGALIPDMTPREYLTFVGEIKGVRDEQLDRRVRDALTLGDLLGVENILNRSLTDGMQRRLGIVQTLLGDPDIVLLDEPTDGLNAGQVGEIRALIRRIGEKMTVVITAATVADLGGLCDHVITLKDGRAVADEDIAPSAVASVEVEPPAAEPAQEMAEEVSD